VSYRLPVYELKLVRDHSVPFESRPITSSPAEAARILREVLGDNGREHFGVLLLNTKNRIIGAFKMDGTVDRAIVYPREILTRALLADATGLIIGHNHPSGDPDPSQEDRHLTRSIVAAANLFEIRVLDHVIIGDATNEYYSFQENRLMPGADLKLAA